MVHGRALLFLLLLLLRIPHDSMHRWSYAHAPIHDRMHDVSAYALQHAEVNLFPRQANLGRTSSEILFPTTLLDVGLLNSQP